MSRPSFLLPAVLIGNKRRLAPIHTWRARRTPFLGVFPAPAEVGLVRCDPRQGVSERTDVTFAPVTTARPQGVGTTQ